MVDVKTEIMIDCSISKVSTYASNPDNVHEWYVNIYSVEWKSPKPLRVGSEIAFKAKFLGRDLSYIYNVVEWNEEKKFRMKTIDGPFPMETSYTWDRLEDGQTKMLLRNNGKPIGFSKFLTPFITLMMKRANRKDLKKLKEILENQS